MVATLPNWQATLALALTLTAHPSPALSSPITISADICSRAALIEAADAYVASQAAGSLSATLSKSLATPWTYEENNKVIDLSKGVLSKPLKIDSRRTIADTTACASFTELIVADAASPYVIGTQIRHNSSSPTLAITLIDTVASTTGAWLFDAKKTLDYAKQQKWDPIP